MSVLKFNVDGRLGELRLTGVEGVLRNSFGKVLIMFLKHVGIMTSNEVDVLII